MRTLLSMLGIAAIAIVPGVAARQPAGHVWTAEALFRRNVGSRDDQHAQFPPHKINRQHSLRSQR